VVSAPVFRNFMIDATKDAPATEFHIPPGLQMVRVDPNTMQPADGGGQSIWIAYKPGTGPDTNRDMGLQGVPGENSGLISGGEAARQPASGTGGLY
jgi:penicillin-binding protein 1A